MGIAAKFALFCLVPWLASSSVFAANKEVVVERLEVKLFYKETGRLSDDILARAKPFVAWNTIIGEGDAEESADDILVVAVLSSGKWDSDNEVFSEFPLSIKVTDSKGKILGSRVFDSVLTSDKGLESKALWLQNVTCAGDILIETKFNGKIKQAHVEFNCGE
jgi:hypothetical protein